MEWTVRMRRMDLIWSDFARGCGLILLLLMVGAAHVGHGASSGDEASDKGTPRLVFSEPVFEFGEVDAGEAVVHEFVYYNKGDAPLKVSDVSPACGCTVAEDWNRELAPGEKGTMAMTLDTSTFTGPIQKSITVKSNDPENPTQILRMKGSVWRPIEVDRRTVYFRVNDPKASPTAQRIRITNNMDRSLKLSVPHVERGLCRAKLETVRPGQVYALNIEAPGPFDCYSREDHIRLKTNSPQMPEIVVDAVVMMEKAFVLLPREINWPAESEAKHTSVVTIINKGETRKSLSNPSTSIEGINVRMKEVHGGNLYRVFVEFPADFQVPEEATGEVSVEVDDPDCPTIKIPVVHNEG